MKDLESRLEKLYDRLEGEFIKVSLKDSRQVSLSRDELLRLLVAAIKAAAGSALASDEDKAWLQSEDAAFIQSITPGQDKVLDLMQSLVASIEGGEKR